jgi:S-adenosylhomocysteine hydrolase
MKYVHMTEQKRVAGLTQDNTALKDRIVTDQKQVVVVGLGYVGLPLAIVARERGHRVFGVEILKIHLRRRFKRSAFLFLERLRL